MYLLYFVLVLGSTECQILAGVEDIVDNSLPATKLACHF